MTMTLEEVSGFSKIPVKVLRKMIDDGAFSEEMKEVDLEFFHRLLAIIGKHYFIRHCLLSIRPHKRENFIESASLDTKWERYLYTHMLNHYSLGNQLVISEFVERAEKVFHFSLNAEQIAKVKKLRDAIYKKQSRLKLNNSRKDTLE